MKLVFVSGPYRGNVAENIHKAREVAIRVWQAGHVAICPHLNTAHFDGYAPDEVWLQGDLEILRRCDAITFVDGWECSEGARAEAKLAKELGLEVILP